MKTYTPELAPEVLGRLDAYAARFRDDFNRPRQAQYSGVYLQGLILDGDRKSIEPLSRKVTLPAGLVVADLDQALQQFIGQSTWDEQAVWSVTARSWPRPSPRPAGVFVIDDTSFPKQGKLSVGVRRQYCGAQGKKANCQVAPSVHYVGPEGTLPAGDAALPAGGLAGGRQAAGQGRRARGGAAGPDQGADRPGVARPRCGPRGCPAGSWWPTPATASPGRSATAWPQRGLHYIVGVTDEMVVFTEEPAWEAPGPAAKSGGRPPQAIPPEGRARPVR